MGGDGRSIHATSREQTCMYGASVATHAGVLPELSHSFNYSDLIVMSLYMQSHGMETSCFRSLRTVWGDTSQSETKSIQVERRVNAPPKSCHQVSLVDL